MEITETDLIDLLSVFAKKAFDARTSEAGSLDTVTSNNCEYLMKLDYSVIELDNSDGTLCARYPERIFIPEHEHGHMASTITANIANSCNSTSGFESGNGFASIGSASVLNNVNSNPPRHTKAMHNGWETLPSATDDISVCSLNTATLENGNGVNRTTSGLIEQPTTTTGTNALICSSYTGNGSDSDSSIQSFVSFAPKPMRHFQQYSQQQHTIYEDLHDVSKIRDLIQYARYARCRLRFAVPVILFRGKFICRSATLAVPQEAYGRYAYDLMTGSNTNGDENNEYVEDSQFSIANDPQFSYDVVIKSDVLLLNTLNVNTIVDLMVENRKTKYFLTVSSSEKADSSTHYDEFNLLSLPYPGCEFFKKFRDNNYMAKGLYYNWQLSFNDANISIPKIGPAMDPNVTWEDYQKWDLVEITQNYLKAMLKYVQEENTGLLVHCISGWDRTPLFISLLRLSLWADGLIHQTLDPMQITYLTLAYDWYLFGHQLPDRLKYGEDILFFCFHVLKFLFKEEFSLVDHRIKRTKTSSSSGSSSVIILKQEDDAHLREEIFLAAYDQDSNDSYSNLSNCDMAITETPSAMALPVGSIQATTCNNALTSRSPNPKRSRTSPISVPGANAMRQRQESVSSDSSWLVVTDTGSVDSIKTGSYMRNNTQRSESSSAHSNNSIPLSYAPNSGATNSIGNSDSGGDVLDCSTSTNNCSGSNGASSNCGIYGYGTIGGSFSVATSTYNMLPATAEEAEAAACRATTSNRSITPPTIREQRLNAVRAIFIRAYGKSVGLKFKEGSGISSLIGTLF